MDEALKILVVEDDAVTRARLAFLLRKNGYQVDVAEDGDQGWDAFQGDYYPIVLSDWSMPGLSGPELCGRIRAYEGELYTYLILITGKTEKSNIAQGLEAGADDYVTKPFDSGELLARLRTGRRILDLQASMRDAQRQLQELASRDGLTGVLNRRALEERLAELFSYLLRRATPLSLAMLDLDHFKRINDTYGHQAGDDVLREAALRVSGVVREYDAVGRYGGEEFMVLLPDTPADEAGR
ncbi:MAG: diguanylate cyclase, partial [Myxococcota bacterium]